jgi:peptidyl-tRNA hydrolase
MEKDIRYLKQVICVRRDLNMPTGKLAAMVAHAAMTFLLQPVTGHLKIYR